MSKIIKCDVCGKTFVYGFSIEVNTQGSISFTDITHDRFETGLKDVCRDCYYKIKKMLVCYCIPESEESDV